MNGLVYSDFSNSRWRTLTSTLKLFKNPSLSADHVVVNKKKQILEALEQQGSWIRFEGGFVFCFD